MPTNAAPPDEATVADALAAHWAAGMAPNDAPHQWECECGQPLDMSDEAHQSHVARALLDSPALADLLAAAWDLGRVAERRDWEFTWDLSTPDEDRQPWPNPYRKAVQ